MVRQLAADELQPRPLVGAAEPEQGHPAPASSSRWASYVGTSWGYRDLLRPRRSRLSVLAPAAVLGAVLGCLLLLVTSEEAFARVVPWLVIVGALLLAVQGRVTERVRRWPGAGGDVRSPLLHVGLVVAAAYGAYFGGGLGVVLLVVLGLFVADDLQRLNALKSVLSLVINAVALVAFALFGSVDWTSVAVLAPSTLVGGYLDSLVAQRLSAGVLRAFVVVLGVAVGLALL